MSDLDSPTIGKVTSALLDAMAEFKPAKKNATNPHYGSKYVDLAGVNEAVMSALRAHRIAVVQPTDRDPDGTTVLLTRLIHESGEFLGGRYPVKGVKADPQAEGSALTYARRFALMAMVGMAPEDDDGNAASQAPARQAPRKAAPPKEPPPDDGDYDTAPFITQITAAATSAELVRIGGAIKSTDMPDWARSILRASYAGRLEELTQGVPA